MPRLVRLLVPIGVAVAATSPLVAQNRSTRLPAAAAIQRAAETITATQFRDRVGVISDDSMRGRDTPSPELDRTAAYIAAEFQRLGLRPGGDSGSYIQRYRLRRTQIDTASYIAFTGRGVTSRLRLGRDFGVAQGQAPDSGITAPVVLISGIPSDSARPFGDVTIRGSVVLHAVSAQQVMQGQAALNNLVTRGLFGGARAYVILVGSPLPPPLTQLMQASERPQSELAGPGGAPPFQIPPIVIARDSGAFEALRAAGVDVATLFSPTGGSVRALDGFTAALNARRIVLGESSAPNVVGVIEGSDPQLRGEALVYSAHMDHLGVGRPVDGDSIFNGADDNASGTAGVVELAEAFASLSPRPRRSMVFLAVSGEEKGLWGSSYYTQHPAVPLAQTVADFTLDMIGRNWRDTVSALGQPYSTLGEALVRVAGAHPELNMRVVGDLWPQENYFYRSDHINFARRGVPVLSFSSGDHPDYHRVTDSVEKIDAEKTARIIRLVFYLGVDVANADARPQWDPASRRQIVQGPGN